MYPWTSGQDVTGPFASVVEGQVPVHETAGGGPGVRRACRVSGFGDRGLDTWSFPQVGGSGGEISYSCSRVPIREGLSFSYPLF